MSNQYFIYRNDKVRGPFSEARIRSLYAEGKLREEDLVSTGDEGDWQPLSTVLSMSSPGRQNLRTRSAVETRAGKPFWIAVTAVFLVLAGFGGWLVLRKNTEPVLVADANLQKPAEPDPTKPSGQISEVPQPAVEPKAAVEKSELRDSGAFGFPQKEATILCDDERVRLSVSSNSEYLFVQAVLWQDGEDGLGKLNDGREMGDTSNLTLDLDCDRSPTANVDRSYSLNPWPKLRGLNYHIELGSGNTTTLKSDSTGRGSIQYVDDSPGRKVRVDTYLVPFKELGIDANKEIRLSFWAGSQTPRFAFSAVGTRSVDAEYSLRTPHSDHYSVKLSNAPVTYDVAKIPEGRLAKPAASDRPSVASISPGVAPPEIQAADWLNTNSPVSLESLRGQTVMVEFWATWCGPCIAGIPHLNEMQKKYGGKGFRILSLTAEDRETVEAFQKTREEPIEYTVGLGSETSTAYGVRGIPAAFLIGTDGKLLWNGHPSSPQCEEAIAKALGAPIPASLVRNNQPEVKPGKVTDVGKTMESAAKKKAIHEALLKKIEQSKKEVEIFKRGHVIVGRIETPGSNDPETVRSQMTIEDEGYFADAVGDLKRPIGFRQPGYRPLDLVIPEGAVPDENGVIDVGTLLMEQAPQSELRRATGQITLEGGGSPEDTQVYLALTSGPVNTPHNGTEGYRRTRPSTKATIDSNGHLIADGLSEGEYYVSYRLPGFVDASQSNVKVDPQRDLVLEPVDLEKPRMVSLEFIVAKESTAGFDASQVKKEKFPAGKGWRADAGTVSYGSDLEFKQIRRNVTFDFSYGPCTMADLGEGSLADLLQPPADAVQKSPRSVALTSGHVYWLKQGHWKHDVLFRIEVSEPNEPKNPRVLAHLNFNENSVIDLADNGASCDVRNPLFEGTAYLSNGHYDQNQRLREVSQRFVINTPGLNYSTFTVAMRFKPQSSDRQKSNILTGGTGTRWFGLSRTDAGNLAVELNQTRLAELAEFPLPLNQWHDIVCAVDLDKGMIGVSVNSKSPRAIPLPAGFRLGVVSESNSEEEKEWTFTNYSHGGTLLGLVDELTIFDGVFTKKEFEDLQGSLEH